MAAASEKKKPSKNLVVVEFVAVVFLFWCISSVSQESSHINIFILMGFHRDYYETFGFDANRKAKNKVCVARIIRTVLVNFLLDALAV